jgi:hypothetical protein
MPCAWSTARSSSILNRRSRWVASETWLELAVVNGRKLREDKPNVCFAQIAAADDHYDLMCRRQNVR